VKKPCCLSVYPFMSIYLSVRLHPKHEEHDINFRSRPIFVEICFFSSVATRYFVPHTF
jgi:hypothetical protein